MKNSTLLQAYCCVVLGFLTFSAHAGMYKWVDEEGNTHYTQSPPPDDIEAETIKPPPKVDTEGAVESLEKLEKKQEMTQKQRTREEEQEQEAEKTAAEIQQECNAAKHRLASYQRPRVNKVLPDGTRVIIPEEERQAEIQKSEELVKKACKP